METRPDAEIAAECADPEISIVVPCFGEQDNVAALTDEIAYALDGTKRAYEMLFVDDGSTDLTALRLFALTRTHPTLRVLRHAENCGQSAAFATGFAHARGAIVVTLDGDGQNDPADIPGLLARLEAADAVCGVRQHRADTAVRRASSRIGNGFRNWVTGVPVRDAGCALRAIRREALRELPVFNGVHRFLPTLLRLQGWRVVEVEVAHRARRHGVSKYGIRNRMVRGISDCLAMRWWRRRIVAGRRLTGEVLPAHVPEAGDQSERARSGLRRALLLGGLLAFWAALLVATPLRTLFTADGVQALRAPLLAHEALGMPLFVLVTAVAVAVGAPRTAFSVLGGLLFGFATGAMLEISGSLLGGAATFALLRALGPDNATALLPGRLPSSQRLARSIGEHGLTATIALRSFPIGNALLTTVLLCFSGVALRDYVLGSALGMIPATVTYALLGSAPHGHLIERTLIAAAMLLVLGMSRWWIWPRTRLASTLRP
jgi:dolichol-phosphate mannosyltransferase